MEVKNAIMIDGVLHEAILNDELLCMDCSLYDECYRGLGELCAILHCDGFISHGEVNIEKKDE